MELVDDTLSQEVANDATGGISRLGSLDKQSLPMPCAEVVPTGRTWDCMISEPESLLCEDERVLSRVKQAEFILVPASFRLELQGSGQLRRPCRPIVEDRIGPPSSPT